MAISWISLAGEIKKEIVYVGDVINTAARIAEECKKANEDFLLSGEIYNQLNPSIKERCLFYDQLKLRGKESFVKIYGLPINRLIKQEIRQ